MTSREALERIIKSHYIAMAMLCEDQKDDETEKAIEIIKQDLEVLEIIKQINEEWLEGKIKDFDALAKIMEELEDDN